MKVVVVGAGGVGGYFGGRLAAHSSAEVTFLVREGAHASAMKSNGLKVDSMAIDPFAVNPCKVATSAAEIGEVDVVLVSVKAYDLKGVAASLKPLIRKSPPTAVVPLLNGIDAPELLGEVLGKEYVLGGLAKIFAWIEKPGVITQKGPTHELAFGELDGKESDRTKALSAVLTEASITHVVPPAEKGGILAAMWGKFCFICALSGAGAVTRATWGDITADPRSHQVWKDLLTEGLKTGAAYGVKACEGDTMYNMFVKLSETMPAGSTASLQRDMMAGKMTELHGQVTAPRAIGQSPTRPRSSTHPTAPPAPAAAATCSSRPHCSGRARSHPAGGSHGRAGRGEGRRRTRYDGSLRGAPAAGEGGRGRREGGQGCPGRGRHAQNPRWRANAGGGGRGGRRRPRGLQRGQDAEPLGFGRAVAFASDSRVRTEKVAWASVWACGARLGVRWVVARGSGHACVRSRGAAHGYFCAPTHSLDARRRARVSAEWAGRFVQFRVRYVTASARASCKQTKGLYRDCSLESFVC